MLMSPNDGVLLDANMRIELKRLADQASDRGDTHLSAILVSAVGTLDQRLHAAEASLAADALPKQASGLVFKNIRLGGKRTSIRIEAEFWEALEEIARRENRTVNGILERLTAGERQGGNLTSAIRVLALGYFRQRTPR